MRTRPLAVFRNLGDNSFEELLEAAGPGVAKAHRGRGCAFGDFDNDGEVDMLIINLNEDPSFCGTIFAETELDQGETRGSEVQSKCDRGSGSGPLWQENAVQTVLRQIQLLFLQPFSPAFRAGTILW
jgi:hypothetical protein